MSENQSEAQGQPGASGDTGTQPVSETAEQGTPAADQTSVTDENQGDGGTADSADVDGGSNDGAEGTNPVKTSVQDGSLKVGEDVAEKPVWNTATHGPLADDDPRRENYEVI